MVSRRVLYWSLLLGLLLVLAGSGYAQLDEGAAPEAVPVEPVSGLSLLVDQADLIVIGRATNVASRYAVTEWGDEIIVSDVNISLEEVLKGSANSSKGVTLNEIWSGQVGEIAMASSDAPLFVQGERFVLFLKADAEGKLDIVGGDAGKMNIDSANDVPEMGQTLDQFRGALQRNLSGEMPADPGVPDNEALPEEDVAVRGPNATDYVFTGQRWAGSPPTINFVVDNPGFNDANVGNLEQQNAALKLAADTWTVTSGAKFNYRYTGTATGGTVANNGVNIIMVRNQASGNALATAFWFFNTTTNIISDCDIVAWDANFAFSATGAANRFDILTVMMHEFGHCLGLGHSLDPQASMFASVAAGAVRRQLHPDDLAGARLLYNVGSASLWVNQFGHDAGGWRVDQHPRLMGDVNGDGRDDVVGFSAIGPYVALSTGARFTTPSLWVAQFGTLAGGWQVANHPRMLADVNGDGMDDIVGFANDGVYVSISQGLGFTFPTRWVNAFGYNDGWRTTIHPRYMADVNADGRADVVGFANNGVYVSTSTGTSFTAATQWVASYAPNAGGWQEAYNPRMMADVNADGRADVVGFANDGVYVSTSTGTAFSAPSLWINTFGYTAGGWRVDQHPRMMADVNGDGRADVVGFGNAGVYVATSSGTAFVNPARWVASFGAASTAGSWSISHHPRFLADVNGDGMDDVVGFAGSGVFVATSTGSAFNAPIVPWVMTYGNTNGGWQVAFHPRLMADVDGNGRADVVGFGNAGVYVSRAAYPDVFE